MTTEITEAKNDTHTVSFTYNAGGTWEKEVYTYGTCGELLTYSRWNDPEHISSACSYTYAYKELSPAEAETLAALMQAIFTEYLPKINHKRGNQP